jgi:asparagine synthase (glutamine-hydrolysing)
MCGIVGIISMSNNNLDISFIKDMADIIKHRGPDSYGEYSNSIKSVLFGHRRLSIIDLSESGKQPMEFHDLVITYNGEIYNYIELRDELISLGYSFTTNTDTEIILSAYKQWGFACVNRFNGMWSFAIYDKSAEIVFCSRDRYGIKPFYYTLFNNDFYFASEIKCFTTLPNWKSKLNESRAYDFLNSGYLSHTEETLFQDVYELRGGYNYIINIETKEINKYLYYDPSVFQSDKDYLNEKETIKSFKDLMTDSIKIALRSDVKVGSALSGGLDSSIIVAVINKIFKEHKKENLQECISACYPNNEKNIDESKYIDSLSNLISINVHKVFPNWEKFLIDLDKMVWHQDEPIPTMSIFAQYCVFEEAQKQNIKVMLKSLQTLLLVKLPNYRTI